MVGGEGEGRGKVPSCGFGESGGFDQRGRNPRLRKGGRCHAAHADG